MVEEIGGGEWIRVVMADLKNWFLVFAGVDFGWDLIDMRWAMEM